MPLDDSDKAFINLALAYVVRQIAGTDEYLHSPLTIKAVRDDIGYIAGPGGSPNSLAVIHAATQAAAPAAPVVVAPTVDLDALAQKLAPLLTFPTVDYAALAKAVNDDAAKRMVQ